MKKFTPVKLKHKRYVSPREEIRECPICKSKTFHYASYSEWGWGTVEQHGNCDRCGYFIEQAYSPAYEGIMDRKKGRKQIDGSYFPKNKKRHKRIRRKAGITREKIDINEFWMEFI